MPYVKHERYKSPVDRTKIWRYIDFTQLVQILEHRSLFFRTIASMREQDPYEGSPYNFISDKLKPIIEKNAKTKKYINSVDSGLSLQACVNCWHINKDESASLWKLYPINNTGIAIVSTIARFKKAIANSQEKVYLVKIVYDNSKTIPIPKKLSTPVHKSARSMYVDDHILYKRPCYRHEKELRAFVYRNQLSGASMPNRNGLFININLNILIQKVIVSPDICRVKESRLWVCDLIERVCHTYGYKFNVLPSKLFDSPH